MMVVRMLGWPGALERVMRKQAAEAPCRPDNAAACLPLREEQRPLQLVRSSRTSSHPQSCSVRDRRSAADAVSACSRRSRERAGKHAAPLPSARRRSGSGTRRAQGTGSRRRRRPPAVHTLMGHRSRFSAAGPAVTLDRKGQIAPLAHPRLERKMDRRRFRELAETGPEGPVRHIAASASSLQTPYGRAPWCARA